MLSTVANRFALIATLTVCFFTQSPSYAAQPASEAKVVATLYQDYAWQAITTQSDLFGEGMAGYDKKPRLPHWEPGL
jgi:hypothetical protein